MASVTKATNNDEKTMSTEDTAGDAEDPREQDDQDERDEQRQSGYRAPAAKEAPSSGGFFSIYKKGQGYWTRICTAGGVVLLLALTVQFLYNQLPVLFDSLGAHRSWLIGITAGFIAAAALLSWYIMNKPDNVDFLIATDSEMKKVNWTSKKELIGSTKVVIFFMIVIAAVLFFIDVFFGYVFYWVRVLKTPPF